MEQQVECAEKFFGAGIENVCQVGFEVAGGAGTGAVIVETPDAAVGQHTPPNPSVGGDVGCREVTQDLAVGRTGLDFVVLVSGVQWQSEAFALFDHRSVQVAVLCYGFGGGPSFRHVIDEKEVVGNVLVAGRALLRQIIGPSEEFQDRANQFLLGNGFVGLLVALETVVDLSDTGPERGDGRSGSRPFRRGLYAVGKEIVGE